MKKIIYVLLFSSITFSMSGNDFLKDYPFGKDLTDMTDQEYHHHSYYAGLLEGTLMGNAETLLLLSNSLTNVQTEGMTLLLRVCKMTEEQQMRIIKKFCDNNPDKTHYSFNRIIFWAFSLLPINSPEDC